MFEFVVIVALILAGGFFAGAEIAVVAVRRTRLLEMVDGGRGDARAALALRDRPERFLATVQIGITVVGATAAAFGGASLAARLAPVLARAPWLAPYAHDVALAIVVAVVSYLSIVLGELVPKSLALRGAEKYALLVARPLLALSWLARPLVWFLTASSNVVLKPFGDRTTFTEARHSPEELQQLVEEAMKAGTVHPDAAEIASRALEFQNLTVAEVMVPRQEVVMLPRHARPEDVRRILLEHAHTRMPVYEESADNVVGYVHVRDLLVFAWEQKLVVLEDVMRPAHFVPESLRAVDLLEDLRTRRVPFAIVVDEQGGLAGIITMEDLLEELVGEIFSEHVVHVPQLIRKEAAGTAIVSGATPIRDVNRALGLDLPEDPQWSTIAGLCLSLAGRIPTAGEKLAVPDGVTLEIVDASARRIRTVRVHLPAPPAKRH